MQANQERNINEQCRNVNNISDEIKHNCAVMLQTKKCGVFLRDMKSMSHQVGFADSFDWDLAGLLLVHRSRLGDLLVVHPKNLSDQGKWNHLN